MTKARFLRYAITGAGFIAALWLLGLIIFVTKVSMMNEMAVDPSLEATDAIVVLTGGSERVPTGLELLKAHKGKKLFITGVPHGLGLNKVFGNQPIEKELRDCCIILGHEAETTIGNAEETLTWMAIENYTSMRLVTANYHMPRSLLIFNAAMPDTRILPYPVAPDSVKLRDWWTRRGTARLLVTEYNKFLLALTRIQLQ